MILKNFILSSLESCKLFQNTSVTQNSNISIKISILSQWRRMENSSSILLQIFSVSPILFLQLHCCTAAYAISCPSLHQKMMSWISCCQQHKLGVTHCKCRVTNVFPIYNCILLIYISFFNASVVQPPQNELEDAILNTHPSMPTYITQQWQQLHGKKKSTPLH